MYTLTIFSSPWSGGPNEALAEHIACVSLERACGGAAGVLALWQAYVDAGGAQTLPEPPAVVAWEQAVADALSAAWRLLPVTRLVADDPSSGWIDAVISDASIQIEKLRGVRHRT